MSGTNGSRWSGRTATTAHCPQTGYAGCSPQSERPSTRWVGWQRRTTRRMRYSPARGNAKRGRLIRMSDAVWPDVAAQIELISVADAAAVLVVRGTRVRQCLRDGTLLGLRRAGGAPRVPAGLLQGAAGGKAL